MRGWSQSSHGAFLTVHIFLTFDGGALDGALRFFFSSYSFPSDLVFAFYPPVSVWKSFMSYVCYSNSWKTHGCKMYMSIYVNLRNLFSVSLLLVLPPHKQTHMFILNPQCDSSSGVRRVLQTALNLSEALMPVGLKLSRTGPLNPHDSAVLNHFQLSLSEGFNLSGRSKFA